MTLTELRYIVVALACEHHSGRAAGLCSVSRPTLSVAVKKQEDTTGVALFERGKTEEVVMDINIGINEQDQAAIAAGLSRLLADSDTFYIQNHNVHWSVTDPMFDTLHLMFETRYTEPPLAVDQIAERIRAPGFPAPGDLFPTWTE